MSNNGIKITILLFAGLKERAKSSKIEMEIDKNDKIIDVRRKLGEIYPDIKTALSISISAINQEFSHDLDPIPDRAEVAFFPPVGGGQPKNIIKIVEDAFDIDGILEEITNTSTGASCIFTGMVRGLTSVGNIRETSQLHYEAYTPMAEEKMLQISNEIRIKWPEIDGIAILQRIGTLQPGTPTVIVACSSSHRDSGIFEATRYGIDRLKEIVPIWKKEISLAGESWVDGHYHPKQGD